MYIIDNINFLATIAEHDPICQAGVRMHAFLPLQSLLIPLKIAYTMSDWTLAILVGRRAGCPL